LSVRPHVGLSLMLEPAHRDAVLPLFEAGIVDAIEWSFDHAWAEGGEPEWASALCDHYAAHDRLWGHGVAASPGSAEPEPRQSLWLERFARDIERRSYRGVSEHFGFMVAGDRDGGAPLPVPAGPGAVAVLVRALERIAAVARVPVGLENLALALHERDALEQGPLLAEVLARVDGYLVLDLHNVWCQSVNYGLDVDALVATYPLERARCMHVSGGSWWTIPGTDVTLRRDTHDGDVPNEVLALVERLVPQCAALECIFLERLGDTIPDARAAERLRADFQRLQALVGGLA
jgi:uncharacterized protein (UPF0276 family)